MCTRSHVCRYVCVCGVVGVTTGHPWSALVFGGFPRVTGVPVRPGRRREREEYGEGVSC